MFKNLTDFTRKHVNEIFFGALISIVLCVTILFSGKSFGEEPTSIEPPAQEETTAVALAADSPAAIIEEKSIAVTEHDADGNEIGFFRKTWIKAKDGFAELWESRGTLKGKEDEAIKLHEETLPPEALGNSPEAPTNS
jgi:hypothetical protein